MDVGFISVPRYCADDVGYHESEDTIEEEQEKYDDNDDYDEFE